MRQFVVVGHDVPTAPDLSLDDLPGAGRLDVLCRCVTAAFLLSHGIREDVRTHLVVGDQYTITFDGAELRNLNPDERSTAALIRDGLEVRQEAVGAIPAEASPGVSIARRDFAALLEGLADGGTVIHFHEDGEPVVAADPPADPVFVLSDHSDFATEERSLLSDLADRRVRLGPEPLHADQAITVAHNYLDTDGYTRF